MCVCGPTYARMTGRIFHPTPTSKNEKIFHQIPRNMKDFSFTNQALKGNRTYGLYKQYQKSGLKTHAIYYIIAYTITTEQHTRATTK
jgi:hypothetical protein